MRWNTHIIFAFVVCIILTRLLSLDFSYIALSVALITAILPDMDLFIPFLKHRGILHTVWLGAVLSTGVYLISRDTTIALFCGIGYLSHLLIDGFTKMGVKPFAPIQFEIKGPITTGKWGETIIFILLLVLAGGLLCQDIKNIMYSL